MIHRFKKAYFCRAAVVAVLTAGALAALPLDAQAAQEGAACATTERRALDFWLGEWSIAAPGSAADATSNVSLDLGQCVVVERWQGERNHSGENLFGYSADEQSWHGLFADNQGRVHVFLQGKVASGTAEFTGPSRGPQGESVLNKITVRRIDADHVEQMWQKSTDSGKSWTKQFVLEYTRKAQ